MKHKRDILLALEKIGNMKIEQGINYKTLCLSLKQHYKDEPMSKWRELVGDMIERELKVEV